VRQRNVSGSPLQIPDIPALVLPGDEIDYDQPLAGFELVDDPPDKGDKTKPSAPAKTADKSTDGGDGK
jgi:hypothetical protein